MSDNTAAAAAAAAVDDDRPSAAMDLVDPPTEDEANPGDTRRDLRPAGFAIGNEMTNEEAEDVDTEEPTTTSDNNVITRPGDKSNLKVVIHGVMAFHHHKAISKMVDQWLKAMQSSSVDGDKLNIEYDRVKKPPKATWAVVIMKDESMVQPLIDYINGSDLRNQKGNKLFAKPGIEEGGDTRRSSDKRPRNENGDDPNASKRQRNIATTEKIEQARRPITVDELKDRVTPLWKLTQDEQLQKKKMEMIKKCVQRLIKDLKAKFRLLNKGKGRDTMKLYPWILGKRNIEVEPILSAPTPLRNKCEFTIGYRYLFDETDTTNCGKYDESLPSPQQEPKQDSTADDSHQQPSNEPRKVPACGFLVTGWAGGVAFSNELQNIPSEMGVVVDTVNQFLLDSPLEPYDQVTHAGCWRLLTVRLSRRTRECMLIIQHAPVTGAAGVADDFGATTSPNDVAKPFADEKERLIAMLTKADLVAEGGEPFKVTSIFFQEFDGVSSASPEHPVQHAYGKTFLTERLGKCLFQISPGAFFQVNTEGAETLYKLAVDKVREVADEPKKTLLFDVCCGTGTIGLTMMKEGVVGSVVGVDVSEPAIEDARKNAALNGFSGDGGNDAGDAPRFVAARAESVLVSEIKKAVHHHKDTKFVVVVDPARDGLHPDVIKTIRINEQISRLVYVSCNPTATLPRDAVLFCSPPTKKYAGRPFQITASTPVDMFPLTNHCELVMTFDRLTDAEMKGEVVVSETEKTK